MVLGCIVGENNLVRPDLIDLASYNLPYFFKALLINDETFEIADFLLDGLLDDLYGFSAQIILKTNGSLFIVIPEFEGIVDFPDLVQTYFDSGNIDFADNLSENIDFEIAPFRIDENIGLDLRIIILAELLLDNILEKISNIHLDSRTLHFLVKKNLRLLDLAERARNLRPPVLTFRFYLLSRHLIC